MLYSRLRLGSLTTELLAARFSSTRKSLLALAAAAAVGVTAFGAVPASAQQTKIPAACANVPADGRQAQCVIDHIEADTRASQQRTNASILRTNDAMRRGAAADAELSLLEREKACKAQIIAAARSGAITINFPQPPVGQFCNTARNLGLKISSLQN